jgi:hypothetical protein
MAIDPAAIVQANERNMFMSSSSKWTLAMLRSEARGGKG